MKVTLKAVAVTALAGVLGAALFVSGPASAGRRRGLIATLGNGAGGSVGTVRFIRADDGKVIVRARAAGLTPGFHGFHVHTVGVCDPAASDSTGAAVPFVTAGGHYNPDTTATHGAHAGDMPPMLVAADGTTVIRFKTDRFLLRDLMDADGSAVILHAGPDNLAHVPAAAPSGAERYHSHVDDVFGPDAATKATGDAGSRFACGVIARIDA